MHFRIKDVNVFRAVVDVVDLVNDDGGLHRKFVILVFRSDARGNNRHENGNDTCAERARKTRNCQHFSAGVGVVGHCGRKSPVRNVRNRIHDRPDNVNHRKSRKAAARFRVPGQEAQNGNDADGNRHPFEIRTALAPLRTGSVNDAAHNGIVESVEDTRAEHEPGNRHNARHNADFRVKVKAQCVCHEDGKITADNRTNEVLSETGNGISNRFFRLHSLARRGAEKLMKESVDFWIFTHNLSLWIFKR